MDPSPFHKEASGLLFEYTHIEEDWENAKTSIQNYVLKLLENDLPALYQLLYRVDIDERRARLAFGSDTGTIALNLTELIMERIIQKAVSRLKYKQGPE